MNTNNNKSNKHYAREGTCVICHEENIVAEYFDGEYFPSFCKSCLENMIKDIDDILTGQEFIKTYKKEGNDK